MKVLLEKWYACLFALSFSLLTFSTFADDKADVLVYATSRNPSPETLPGIRVLREKRWGEYYTMVMVRFPNIPDFTCDCWCYESEVDFVDALPGTNGTIEMRHRDRNHQQVLVVTTVTPTPGAVEFRARMSLDTKNHPDVALPEEPTSLNLCWQLRHAPGFSSLPDPYTQFAKRCFIFTEKGRTFLLDTERNKIPTESADQPHNNPPWVQRYVGMWQPIPKVTANSWSGISSDRYITTVIGAVSRDGQYLTAIANDSATGMAQAWHDCMHNNPQWLPADGPVVNRQWRLKIYAMENDPKALLLRVGDDFPNAKHLGEPPRVP